MLLKNIYSKIKLNLLLKIFQDFLIFPSIKNIKIDYVIHAAANFANENSVLNPVKDLKSNIFTLNVLELSKKKIKKFIYLSSSCVYGDNVDVKENSKINQTKPRMLFLNFRVNFMFNILNIFINLTL